MKTPCDKLAKIYTNCSGLMTKMAKNPLKIFSKNQKHNDCVLACSIGDVGPTKIAQMMIIG